MTKSSGCRRFLSVTATALVLIALTVAAFGGGARSSAEKSFG
jgi:hypothetical protein